MKSLNLVCMVLYQDIILYNESTEVGGMCFKSNIWPPQLDFFFFGALLLLGLLDKVRFDY